MSSDDCLFCRIVTGEIPSDRVFEDGAVIAFRDINPQAPTHVLVVPRRHVVSVDALAEGDGELLAASFAAIRRVAADAGLRDGYRVVVNNGPLAGQSVPHLHFHVLGGRPLRWPAG